MLILFAIFALLLLAGSLFPWSFRPGPDLLQAARHVATSWDEAARQASLHDVLINLVIYVPIGFTAYLWQGWRSRLARWFWPLAAGLGLSFSIETLQHYFPPRAPGLADVVCNTLSAAAGAVLAALFQSVLASRHIEWRRRYSLHLSSALLLLAIWLAASAWPIHTYPLGIGMRIRALLRPAPWAPSQALEALGGALVWLLAGCLLAAVTGPRAARWWLWALLPAVFLLMLIAPGHDFTWSHLGGALAAALLFWLLPQRQRRAAPYLAVLWLAWIVADGLRPYTLLSAPQRFGWVPFKDMLGSSWMTGIAVLLSKTWIYGAAFWLLAHTRLSHRSAIGVTLLCICAVEAAQCWLPGRVASLTDPAIGLLAAALLWLVDHRFTEPA